MSWYRLAANRGDASAQHNLGLMYANARGALLDDVEALKWLTLASSRGSGAARRRSLQAREAGAARMSPEQIGDAELRARAWQPAEQKTP